MPLRFHPRVGSILICDYSTGFVAPEMVKRRRVVVISRLRQRADLYTVVPLSTTAPVPVEPYHHRLSPGAYPGLPSSQDVWAKCDMLATVALSRLDRVKIGKRQYTVPEISPDDLAAIRRGVLHALNLGHLTGHL